MRITPFISGIVTGVAAGAVVSIMAAGAMMNPTVRKNVQHSARKAESAVHKAAHSMGEMIG